MAGFLNAVGSGLGAGGRETLSSGCDMSSAEERVRSRELAQYFRAAAILPGKKTADGLGTSDDIETRPRLARNPTLTALSQLGALKLQTARSFISIIDRTHQYVISEATRTVSLRDAQVHADGDGLFMGVRALDLEYGVCPTTLAVFTQSPPGQIAIDTDVVLACREFYMIRDFTKHPNLKDRPYITGGPQLRSYLEVPLASEQGFVIGSYCVVDHEPRSFDQGQIDVLTEIAGTLMQHLDLLKSKEELRRSRALVKGLGLYVDGYSSIHDEENANVNGHVSTSAPPAIANGTSAVGNKLSSTTANEDVEEVIPRPDIRSLRRLSEYGNHVSQEIRDALTRASKLILQSMEAQGVENTLP